MVGKLFLPTMGGVSGNWTPGQFKRAFPNGAQLNFRFKVVGATKFSSVRCLAASFPGEEDSSTSGENLGRRLALLVIFF